MEKRYLSKGNEFILRRMKKEGNKNMLKTSVSEGLPRHSIFSLKTNFIS